MFEKIRAGGRLDDAVRAAIAACLENGGLSLESVATMMSTHPRTLQRRLARVDLTYQQLVDEVRLDLARGLLDSSGGPVAEIAVQLGYADPAHFSRAFSRWTGRSPRDYRDRSIERPSQSS